ncbi:alcohol dehydrogenase [Caulobacter sp. CCUG 60055]|uniref:zinc-binding dehydrogenase n=1 Tax=Caulobacter sp. CCUG 60055 TaxID=2100090 RepID=UPI001FA6F9F4|nr:zinc-binding dehydrogenase [Caulobacter sp. CCUG 60055]MCI3180783.1 alcohol dehydrogenase [Caulobacter sp. CCUG 60055]
MRAVVTRDKRLTCEEIEDPLPIQGQTLVRTLCCGICGSDLHALHFMDNMVEGMRRAGGGDGIDPAKDMVFGHEFCAEVLDHGPGTDGRFKPGTRVVSVPMTFGPAGIELVGYSNRYPGGFSERMVLAEAMLLEVPNGLPAEHAALTEPMAVGAHAVAEAAVDKDSVCLVLGCGPVGLAVIAALKARGHGPVIAADFSPRRRAAAEAMGADIVVDPAKESPHGKWADLGVPATLTAHRMAMMAGQTYGRPIVFECVGAPGVLQSVIEGAPPKAQIVVAGVCMTPDRIEPSLAINKQLDLRFVFGYSPEEFAATLHDIAEGRIDVAPIVTGKVGLAGVADAFKALGDPENHVKILVEPGRA